jgi:hypothetical protein
VFNERYSFREHETTYYPRGDPSLVRAVRPRECGVGDGHRNEVRRHLGRLLVKSGQTATTASRSGYSLNSVVAFLVARCDARRRLLAGTNLLKPCRIIRGMNVFRRIVTRWVVSRRKFRKSGGGGNCTRVPRSACRRPELDHRSWGELRLGIKDGQIPVPKHSAAVI